MCDTNAACPSGACGVTGNGYCCTSACFPILGECGATGCDETGACMFEPSYIYCGGSNGATCNGQGYCVGY